MSEQILIGKSEQSESVYLFPERANRHGLIAGATGTGKTLSLKRLAEQFSLLGIPVFITDVKGDLTGFAKAGQPDNIKTTERLKQLNISDFSFESFPITLWDVFGKHGIPVRTTISEMGPLLLSELLNLNPTQSSVLSTIFKIGDDQGLLLLDLNDLKALLNHVAENNVEYAPSYGNIAKVSIGAIQRQLITLESTLDQHFFGEPALEITDLLQTDPNNGKGLIHLLVANQLMLQPKLYAMFLLWFLSELFETLPEVGDLEKPKFVVFFDEAHLLFNNMPQALRDKIKQVILLIRSKGVGIYFVTQNPEDIDEDVLGQLGNRIQHALRVFTPKDKKALTALVSGFRENPELDLKEIIPQLGIGEAIVSTLDRNGLPTIPIKTWIAPPQSAIGPLSEEILESIRSQNPLYNQYSESIDRISAHEKLLQRVTQIPNVHGLDPQNTGRQRQTQKREPKDPLQVFVESATRAIGSQMGRSLVRGILSSLVRSR